MNGRPRGPLHFRRRRLLAQVEEEISIGRREQILMDLASPELSSLRRFHCEAWKATSADMTYRLERRRDDPPRKLPAVEREEENARLQGKLGN